MLHNPWPEVLPILRKRKKMKQVDAALQGAVDLSTWNGWEKGRHLPSLDYLEKITIGVDCSWDELGREIADSYQRRYYGQERGDLAEQDAFSPFRQIEKIMKIDLEVLPDDVRAALRQQRDIINLLIALYGPLINVFKDLHLVLSKRLPE